MKKTTEKTVVFLFLHPHKKINLLITLHNERTNY
jgi:hypothetical protein